MAAFLFATDSTSPLGNGDGSGSSYEGETLGKAATVMRLIGWESDAMFRRYFIVDEEVLREAGERLAEANSQGLAKVGLKPLQKTG